MVDLRALVEQATRGMAVDFAHATSSVAGQSADATQALADAFAAALRTFQGKLAQVQLPRIQQSLEELADQLSAMSARLRTLGMRAQHASVWFCDAELYAQGKTVVDGFRVVAGLASSLRPSEHSVLRWVPERLSRPYVDAVERLEAGVRAAGGVADAIVNALPEVGGASNAVGEDLRQAGQVIELAARALRELARAMPI